VTMKVPDHSQAQLEQAQAALRDGLERARRLIGEAKLAMRQRSSAQSCPWIDSTSNQRQEKAGTGAGQGS
jgi:hypothetical protein